MASGSKTTIVKNATTIKHLAADSAHIHGNPATAWAPRAIGVTTARTLTKG